MGKGCKIAATVLVLCLLLGCGGEPALAAVPDVTEADRDTAATVLTGQGFVPVVKEIADPTAPVGTVLRTDPPAGSYVAVGGKVYLFVAADVATTTPHSTTLVPFSSTSAPQATTSATQVATSLPLTTTTAIPTTTVTHPCATGHNFAEGICAVCGKTDPDFVPTLSLGQTWTVENQWSFTLLGVTTHSPCSPVPNAADTVGRRVVILRYTYENHGFVSEFDRLLINGMAFTVTEESGHPAALYACIHKEMAVPCAVGERCTAEEAYAVDETCRNITLLVTLRTADKSRIQRVRFVVPLP